MGTNRGGEIVKSFPSLSVPLSIFVLRFTSLLVGVR
jgi:hypothetical protein